MNEILCHWHLDPPHILCQTENHLHHDEVVSSHIDIYTLGLTIVGKQNTKVVSAYLIIIA